MESIAVMTNLTDMLRAQQSYLCDRAAEEIERLQREVVRLQEALGERPTIVMKHRDIRT